MAERSGAIGLDRARSQWRLPIGLLVLSVAIPVGSCSNADEEDHARDRLSRLGLVTPPPDNLVEACEFVADAARVEWICPPVVPAGSLVVDPPTLKRQPARNPFMSLHSASLPQVRDKVHQGHWAVYAGAPAREVRAGIYSPTGSVGDEPPRVGKSRRLSVDDLRAEVVAKGGPELGINKNHAVVYWRLGGTGYVVSVHGYGNLPIAKEIARAMIREGTE